MYRRTVLMASIVTTTMLAPLSFGDVAFHESEFQPGSWSAQTAFWDLFENPQVGQNWSMNTTTDRFIGGNPENSFLVTQYTLDLPGDILLSQVIAPVLFDGWTYDPSQDGAIESVSGGLRTIPVIDVFGGNLASAVCFIYQGDRVFRTFAQINFQAFNFNEAEQTHSFTELVAEDFYELIPNEGNDLEGHPDFAGGEMQFAFGFSLVTNGNEGVGEVTRAIGWDDVNLRITTVPAPGVATILGLVGVCASRRRR